ncbi:hypothetical protein EB001_26840 [bacterium]|nr:hypothetical protein [bacterium]
MRTNLFGETFYEDADIAKLVIAAGSKKPFIKIVADLDRHSLMRDITLKFLDKNEDTVSLTGTPGFYAIFRDKECLYVGQTNVGIYNRVYRFIKELMGMSRYDESHSGGRKARRMGITIKDNLQLKYLHNGELAKVYEEYNINFWDTNTSQLDEHIAYLMKAKCNTRIRSW